MNQVTLSERPFFLKCVQKTVDADLTGEYAGAVVRHVIAMVATGFKPMRHGIKVDRQRDLNLAGLGYHGNLKRQGSLLALACDAILAISW